MDNKVKSTINDVAREAGVSKRTVSRVINGSPSVGQATRERIDAVIKELNFQPDKQARGLASKKSYLLGLIYDNPDALYIDQVQRGCLTVCTNLGYELVVHPCHWQEDDFVEDCLNFISRSNVDGVLILPPVSESKKLASALRANNHPYVRIASADLDDHANIVISNEREAMQDIAEHLVSLGHKDIAMISGPSPFCSSRERLEGFTDSLKKLNIDLPAHRVIEGQNSYESGLEIAKNIFSGTDLPTAIFANNDEMAAGVIRVASDLGIKIPEQVSLAGFDDNIFASRIIPSLTTLRRPVQEISVVATKKLIQAINPQNKAVEQTTVIKPYLITRESTAKCIKED
ncbi:LacI family DNA-binding transcriptional regulator [Paraglaciecola aquimarina]|uniref:LacI family DNA-binding transcriptional regulator n=1 Tax=Paraglaciecola algarum TaxID=3050085 RepID=A0ABS9DB30_9ALTE|nr:LacI family DNA-binding transcriptional regulator [Paraglaciecola sp. G1-23]MCF2949592.1 LacI family DNA-binding transcriptional regulator [Paraglaciecola sp. G1-23]